MIAPRSARVPLARSSFRVVACALSLVATSAHAFCGFYVSTGDTPPKNETTSVVLLRDGTRTVLSMQNDYQGPPSEFAMVVPVPVVLSVEDVHTLQREVFERLDAQTAPRLVEYWEQDPCTVPPSVQALVLAASSGGGGLGGLQGRGSNSVRIEAQFARGEYDIVILSADDSSALDTWLRAHDYQIPEGAAEALRPYVASGSKFFVARVDPERVQFRDGRAVLSPLRIEYESEALALPVRLGMLSSVGTQDLLVHILGRSRFEAANYPNAFLPTNIEVTPAAREEFAALADGTFARTQELSPGAVVTEYAWQASSCDPCPPNMMTDADLVTLGADPAASVSGFRVREAGGEGPRPARELLRRHFRGHAQALGACIYAAHERTPFSEREFSVETNLGSRLAIKVEPETLPRRVKTCIANTLARIRVPRDEAPGQVRMRFSLRAHAPHGSLGREFVVTRLHYRYQGGPLGDEQLSDDLVFQEAGAVVGGREGTGEIATPTDGPNNFQGRFIIRHEWEGPIECPDPQRGVWGGPPSGPAPRLASARRRRPSEAPAADFSLTSLLTAPVTALSLVPTPPETDVTPEVAAAESAAAEEGGQTPPAETRADIPPDPGCGGCATDSSHDPSVPALFALWLFARRRRSSHPLPPVP